MLQGTNVHFLLTLSYAHTWMIDKVREMLDADVLCNLCIGDDVNGSATEERAPNRTIILLSNDIVTLLLILN